MLRISGRRLFFTGTADTMRSAICSASRPSAIIMLREYRVFIILAGITEPSIFSGIRFSAPEPIRSRRAPVFPASA